MAKKFMVDETTLQNLISFVPNDGGPSAELINGLLDLMNQKSKVIASSMMTFTGPGDVEVLLATAKLLGAAVVMNNYTPTGVWIVSNVPEELWGQIVSVKGKWGEVTEEKILKIVMKKFEMVAK